MKLYNLAGWALLGLALLGLNTLRYEPVAYAVDLPAIYAQLDTTTYGDARIVYKLSTDTSRNSNGDLRRLPDLSAAPTGARWRVIWKPTTFDSVMLVTGDTFALSPMDSAAATALATSWGVIDPHTVSLAWHVPPGSAPDPLVNVQVVAVHDTLRTSWTSVGDSVRVFSGLDAGGQEDTFYVAGNSTPHDRVVTSIPGDYFSCGNAYTTQAAGDYAANRCGSATVDTAAPGGGGGGDFPNEPAGLTTIALVDFTDSINAQTGVCTYPNGESANKSIVTNDATTPSGDNSVIRLKYPSGENDGGSNGRRFDCWGPAIDQGSGTHEYQELYVAYMLKIEGSDYENQTIGTKTHYIAYGSLIRSNHSAPFVEGPFSDQGIQSSMRYAPYIYEMEDDGSDAGGGAVKHLPNIQNQNIQPGQWQLIEHYYKINDINPTTDNGIHRVYVDGVHTFERTDVRWRSTQNPKGFYHFQFTPVYGGNNGDVRTRDDFWRIDHVKISAKSF